jgi:hypothetical protein
MCGSMAFERIGQVERKVEGLADLSRVGLD